MYVHANVYQLFQNFDILLGVYYNGTLITDLTTGITVTGHANKVYPPFKLIT